MLFRSGGDPSLQPLASISKCAKKRDGRSPVSTDGRLPASYTSEWTPAGSRRVESRTGGRLQRLFSRSGSPAGSGRARRISGGRLQNSFATSVKCFAKETIAGRRRWKLAVACREFLLRFSCFPHPGRLVPSSVPHSVAFQSCHTWQHDQKLQIH